MIGIYCIRNKINNKRYIGKSIKIEQRLAQHKATIKKYYSNPEKYKKLVNRFLAASFAKYGEDNFEYTVLQEFESCTDEELADAELFWMDFYNTCNRDFGYNLRRDSSTKTTVHEETRKLLSEVNTGSGNGNFGNKWTQEQKDAMSKRKKIQMQTEVYDFIRTPEWREKLSKQSTELWKDEEKKNSMARKVAIATSELRFEQYDKTTGELVGTYDGMYEILEKYPDFHRIAIYSVCNGWKKSYRGFVWKSFLKSAILED